MKKDVIMNASIVGKGKRQLNLIHAKSKISPAHASTAATNKIPPFPAFGSHMHPD